MKPISFKPVAHVRIGRGSNRYALWVSADATLVCTVCEHEVVVSTRSQNDSGYLVEETRVPDQRTESFSDAVRMTLSNLANRRDCENCGITSIIPESDRAELTRMAQEQMTDEWLEGQKQELLKDMQTA